MAPLTISVVSMLSVEEVYVGSVKALTAMSSVLSATSSLWGGIIPSNELLPFRVDLFGVVVQFSVSGWNLWFLASLILSGCLRAVYYLFVEFIQPSWKKYQRKRKKKKRGKCNWRGREKRFRRWKLHVNLVKRCRRRVGNRPPRLDGSRFHSRRDRNARQRCHRKSETKENWESYGAPRQSPPHMDAYDWRLLRSRLCFKFAFLDDFTATLDAWNSGRWQPYPDEFLQIENHIDNAKNFQARAEEARWPRDGNRGRDKEKNGTRETFFSSRSTSFGAMVLGCWRRTSQHSIVGRLTALANDSAHLGEYLDERSYDNFGGASAQLALTNRVPIPSDRRTRVSDRGREQRESFVHRLERKCLEVHASQREPQSAMNQTSIDGYLLIYLRHLTTIGLAIIAMVILRLDRSQNQREKLTTTNRMTADPTIRRQRRMETYLRLRQCPKETSISRRNATSTPTSRQADKPQL